MLLGLLWSSKAAHPGISHSSGHGSVGPKVDWTQCIDNHLPTFPLALVGFSSEEDAKLSVPLQKKNQNNDGRNLPQKSSSLWQ